MEEIEIAIERHLMHRSGVLRCIIVSDYIFKSLKKELLNIKNFEFKEGSNMKYRGIDFYVSENLKNKEVRIY